MKKSEIGLHDHGISGEFVEEIIDSEGRKAEIIVFSESEAEVVEHIMEHHLDGSGKLTIERVFMGKPNLTKFIFSANGIDSLPFHVTSPKVVEGPPPISES